MHGVSNVKLRRTICLIGFELSNEPPITSKRQKDMANLPMGVKNVISRDTKAVHLWIAEDHAICEFTPPKSDSQNGMGVHFVLMFVPIPNTAKSANCTKVKRDSRIWFGKKRDLF